MLLKHYIDSSTQPSFQFHVLAEWPLFSYHIRFSSSRVCFREGTLRQQQSPSTSFPWPRVPTITHMHMCVYNRLFKSTTLCRFLLGAASGCEKWKGSQKAPVLFFGPFWIFWPPYRSLNYAFQMGGEKSPLKIWRHDQKILEVVLSPSVQFIFV